MASRGLRRMPASMKPANDIFTVCRSELEVLHTWAIPVKVEELGASLSAYIACLPQRTAFELCLRKGAGNSSKLPLEVVDRITDLAMQDEKEYDVEEWQLRYLSSSSANHPRTLDYIRDYIFFSEGKKASKLNDFIMSFSAAHCGQCKAVRDTADLDEEDPETSMCSDCLNCLDLDDREAWQEHASVSELAEYLLDQEDWDDARMHVSSFWHNAVEGGTLFTKSMLEVLQKHFGLAVWLGADDQEIETIGAVSTTALLYPARTDTHKGRSGCSRARENDEKHLITSTRCVGLPQVPKLQAEDKSALLKALHKLQLRPCAELERYQCSDADAHTSTSSDKWPQLVVLAKATHRRVSAWTTA